MHGRLYIAHKQAAIYLYVPTTQQSAVQSETAPSTTQGVQHVFSPVTGSEGHRQTGQCIAAACICRR